jgi:predicted outer membrane repeat protein
MVFMSGEHTGFCEKTALKSAAFNVTGIGGRVTIGCTTIELTNVAAIYFENVTLDHWYISSPHPSTVSPLKLVINMSSVIAQNQTHMYVEHARNVSGNFIVFTNCTFKNNSSLSGILYFNQFVGGTFKGGAMSLFSSTLSLGRNTSVTFTRNILRYAALHLNSSTLDIEGACILFLNNQRGIHLYKSALNLMKSNASFLDNASNHSGGGAIYVYNSTMNVSASEMLLLNNSAIGGGAVYAKSSVLVFENNTRVIFKNNTANGIKGVYVPICRLQSITKDNPEGEGGALRMGFSTLLIRFNTSINFIDNLAFLQGGAAHVYYHSEFIVDNGSNVTFNGNSATYSAGALSCVLSNFTARRNTIIEFVNSQSNEALRSLTC